jgi:hypothetical protein
LIVAALAGLVCAVACAQAAAGAVASSAAAASTIPVSKRVLSMLARVLGCMSGSLLSPRGTGKG